jgi:hypothetical protein
LFHELARHPSTIHAETAGQQDVHRLAPLAVAFLLNAPRHT